MVFAAFASCGKEDICTADDFVGTWKGTEICSGITTTLVTIKVTGSGKNLTLSGGGFSEDAVERNNCSLEGGIVEAGAGNKITGNLSEGGKTLTVSNSFEAGTASFTCNYLLKK